MGITTFICPIPTKASLTHALRSIVVHNTTTPIKTGGLYTMEEFAILDPMRHRVCEFLSTLDTPVNWGCMEKWNRGEDIDNGFCFVRFQGQLWLEVANRGGGANTTEWLKKNAPEIGWIGSGGKPDGFIEAPMTGKASDFRGLVMEYGKL